MILEGILKLESKYEKAMLAASKGSQKQSKPKVFILNQQVYSDFKEQNSAGWRRWQSMEKYYIMV